MAKLVQIKTKQTDDSVISFINIIDDEQKRNDSLKIMETMKKCSGEEPKMWGKAIIGFGNKIYESPNTGRQVEWFLIGFSPRKANISLHLTMDIGQYESTLLNKLGKYKSGKGCLYINKLTDIDFSVLEKLIKIALKNK